MLNKKRLKIQFSEPSVTGFSFIPRHKSKSKDEFAPLCANFNPLALRSPQNTNTAHKYTLINRTRSGKIEYCTVCAVTGMSADEQQLADSLAMGIKCSVFSASVIVI